MLLEIISHLAAILTAAVAVFAYGHYLNERHKKRLRLEEYLKAEKETGLDKGQRTVTHLVAALGMTETEVVDAAFRSSDIHRLVITDESGHANRLLFEHAPKSK